MSIIKAAVLSLLVSMPALAEEASPAPAGELHKVVAWLQRQELRAGTQIPFKGELRPVGYLSYIKIGQKGLSLGDAGAESYLDLDPGITIDDQDRPDVLALAMLHPAAIGRRLYSRLPFKDRIRFAGFPEIELGPSVRLPRDLAAAKRWRGLENIGFVLSMRVF